MKIQSWLLLGVVLLAANVSAQVSFPTNPRNYNEVEPWGYEIVGTNWDTSPFLPFIYKNVWFRLLPPNGVTYNRATNSWSFSDPTKKYPVIFFQYGAGEAGTDNNNQLKHGGQRHLNAVQSGEFPGFLVYPQNESVGAISASLTADLINKLMTIVPIDINRIYCHGLSNGAKAAWNFATEYPKMVAAIAPMSGVNANSYQASLLYTPIRLSQGGLDTNPNPQFSQSIVNQYNNAGGQMEYFYFPNNGHDTWNAMYNRSDFFSWFLSQKKNKIFARYKKSEFCPDETVSATLGLTPGFDGYEWRKNGEPISGATGNTITVTEFGAYTARFRRGTQWTEWSDPLEVKIKPTTQTPPIAVTGIKSVVLPAPDGSTTVPLELPEGYATYRWYRNGTQISTERTINATVGSYTASVSETGGCSTNMSDAFAVLLSGGSNAPDPASGLSGTALSKTEVKLNWSDNPNSQYNETSFEIYRALSASGPFTLIAKTGANVTTYNDQSLNPNTEYHYLVRAVNQYTSSANSTIVKVKTLVDSQAPTAPLNLRIVSTSVNSISLQWDASTDDVGVMDYEVYKDGTVSVISQSTTATIYNLQDETIYRFTVRARDFAGNRSPASNQVVGAAVFSGLAYQYFEGDWNTLPNFNNLTPVASGISRNVDISVRRKEDYFAFRWQGFINIPVAGNYTFETNSDDGSKLYIGGYGDQYMVVNNDGLHGGQYREGTKRFTTAGAYPIVITYFEKTGGNSIDVYWKNTAHGVTSRQRIPDSAFDKGFPIPSIVPSAPTNVTATALSHNSVRLNWQDNSSDEVAFQIYRSTGDEAPIPVGSVNANLTTFTDQGLAANSVYYYQIIALGEYGQSETPSSPRLPLGAVKYGIGAIDNATGSGYIMYSAQNVRTRFSSNRPDTNNSDNLIAVRYNTSTARWQYDNNSNYYNFTPAESDILIASVNFSTDVITSLQGTNTVVQGIKAGFVTGDLTFTANRWNNRSDAGEFTVAGTYFQRNSASSVRATTLASPAIPAAPTLSFGEVATTSIRLNWIDNSNNETRFILYRSAANASNFVAIKELPASNAANGTFLDEEVFPNVTYFYRLDVENDGGVASSEVISTMAGNSVPEIVHQADVIMRYDAEVLLNILATDADQQPLTLSATGLPSFITLTDNGNGTGILAIRPEVSTNQGQYTIRINAADQHGGTAFTEFEVTVNDNYPPVLNGVTNISVAEGATTTLNFSATDQNGTESLTWEVTGLPGFAVFSYEPSGAASIAVSPNYNHGGTYPIEIILKDGQGGEVRRSLTLEVTEVNPNVEVRVNFSAGSNAPSPWNNVKGLNSSSLLNTDGANSGIGIAFQTTSWKTYTDGAITGNNSGIYPDIVLKEYYYFGIFGAPNTVSMNVTGLDPDRAYDLSFMGSSVWPNVTNNGTTNYTIGSQTVSLAVQGNTSQLATISNVTPNASGIITVTMSKGAGTSAGYLNAMVIKSLVGTDEAPAAVRELSVELTQAGAAKLSWIDASFNETAYEIFRSASLNGEYTSLASLPANAVTYEDGTIEQENEYFYKVRSVNDNGFSDAAPVSLYVPNVGPNMTVTGNTELGTGITSYITVSLSDPPTNTVSLETVGFPSFGSVTRSGNVWTLAFTPQVSDVGIHTITLIGRDESENEVSQELILNVTNGKVFEVRVNFGSNVTSSSGWNNTAKAPRAGDTFSNLRNIEGTATPVGLTLQTAFGGFYDQGATTGNNSGIVPDDVLKQYYWFGIFGAANTITMKVTGLSQYNKYTFKFVGSSVFSENGVSNNGSTVYTIGDRSSVLNVQGNTSQAATISDIRATANGEVTITLAKASGSPAGYINAMMIEAYALDLTELNPTDLVAYGQDSDVVLSWNDNAFDETGYQIHRANNPDGPYGIVGVVGANQNTYTDANAGQLRYYKIKGVFPERESLYTNVASAGPVAFRVFINVNGASTYDAPVPWNNLSKVPVDFDVFTGLKNASGEPTGMALNFLKNMEGHNDWGPTTGNNSGIYPDNVLKSFYWKNALVEAAKVRIENVDIAFGYNLNFFGAIVNQQAVSTNFTVGNKTVTNAQNNNTNTPVTIKGVLPDESGGILLTINEAPGSPWAIWNALVIEAYPSGASRRETSARTVTNVYPDAIPVRYGESNPSVELYPNPAVTDLNVKLNDIARGAVEIAIRDIWGREVYTDSYDSDLLDDVKHIDIQQLNLPSGVFIMTVRFSNGRAINERFIIAE